MSCREEILTAARRITDRSGSPEFTIQEIIADCRDNDWQDPGGRLRS
jgi:hypothetical protein